jgi:hypothetical protein
LNAQPEQREAFVISGGGTGLHWDELDEDMSVEGLLLGLADRADSTGSRVNLCRLQKRPPAVTS